jgi:phage shock protein C
MPLHRSRDNKVIAGVCAGVAEFLGWSPRLVRVLWVILTPTTIFAGGVLYLLLWLLMPEDQAAVSAPR